MTEIRKIVTLREVIFAELRHSAPQPVVRAVGIAVIRNPFAGRWAEDLRPLFEAGAALGERLMPELSRLLDRPAVSYGKGALVGVLGEVEHGGACVHPMLGRPMRAAVGGGQAVISSNVKVAAPGTPLDVPLGHKGFLVVPAFRHADGVGCRRAATRRDRRRHGDCRWRPAPQPLRFGPDPLMSPHSARRNCDAVFLEARRSHPL